MFETFQETSDGSSAKSYWSIFEALCKMFEHKWFNLNSTFYLTADSSVSSSFQVGSFSKFHHVKWKSFNMSQSSKNKKGWRYSMKAHFNMLVSYEEKSVFICNWRVSNIFSSSMYVWLMFRFLRQPTRLIFKMNTGKQQKRMLTTWKCSIWENNLQNKKIITRKKLS